MRRYFIIGLVIFVAIMFSGCLDQYSECSIQGSGLTLSIDGTIKPITLSIAGYNNTIYVNKSVMVNKIDIAWGITNNTIYLFGERDGEYTSNWSNHNCSLSLGDPSNRIRYYDN